MEELCEYERIRNEIVRERENMWEVREAAESLKAFKEEIGIAQPTKKINIKLKKVILKTQLNIFILIFTILQGTTSSNKEIQSEEKSVIIP